MKFLLATTVLILFSCEGRSQCPSNRGQIDISVSYGSFTTAQLALGTTENNKSVTYSSGSRFISVRYFPFRVMSLGFTGGVSDERGQYNDAYNPSFVKSTYKQHVTVIAPEVYYVYTFRKYFEVYTILGAGPAFTTVTTTTNATAYTASSTSTSSFDGLKVHYTPVGFRVGGRIGGFIELGFGYKGLVNAGLSFKLGRPCWWRAWLV